MRVKGRILLPSERRRRREHVFGCVLIAFSLSGLVGMFAVALYLDWLSRSGVFAGVAQ